jgi:hypothetical protein
VIAAAQSFGQLLLFAKPQQQQPDLVMALQLGLQRNHLLPPSNQLVDECGTREYPEHHCQNQQQAVQTLP